MIIDQMARLFAGEASDVRLRSARAGEPVAGWAALVEAGLPLALAPEAAGGLGLDAATVLGIARAHGQAGAPWPLADAMLLRAPQLNAAAWHAALTSAEIAGLIDTVLTMTLDWTQTRQQFGKPLARNQAVQHALAQMAAEAAAADAAVGLAGLALADPADLLRIGAAKARASEAAGLVAALAHQLHGAIGITADHRLHLFTRALWQARDAHGSEHHHYAVLGKAALAAGSVWKLATAEAVSGSETVHPAGRFRFPAVAETPGHAGLRAEVRAFLAAELAALPPQVRAHSWNGHSADFSARLGARGWIGMSWPTQHGGQARSALDRLVVIEELLAAGAPVAAHWIADRQTGPLLLKYGTPAQQALLPAIASGALFACIGMSEAGAGSDLAALTTRAERVADGWRITGTKLWTTYAHKAHYMLLLCRTGAGLRHEGLTQLLVPLHTPGISIRPIIDLMGEHHFNEVHLADVLVGEDSLVGVEGDGWAQVMRELAFERSGPERFLSTMVLLEELVAALGPAAVDAACAPIGRLAAHLIVLRQMARGMAHLLETGEDPALEAAIVKDLGASFEQSVPEVARALLPLIGQPSAALLATLEVNLHIAPMLSLRGGTREILRGIIARGLGVR